MTDMTITAAAARTAAIGAGFTHYGRTALSAGIILWHLDHADGRILTIHTTDDEFTSATGGIRTDAPLGATPLAGRNPEAFGAAEYARLIDSATLIDLTVEAAAHLAAAEQAPNADDRRAYLDRADDCHGRIAALYPA